MTMAFGGAVPLLSMLVPLEVLFKVSPCRLYIVMPSRALAYTPCMHCLLLWFVNRRSESRG